MAAAIPRKISIETQSAAQEWPFIPKRKGIWAIISGTWAIVLGIWTISINYMGHSCWYFGGPQVHPAGAPKKVAPFIRNRTFA